MGDRHDDVEDWLNRRIDPLAPPPGTFELIKRRARRRKYRKLAITAGTAAVIVAAVVTVPQIVNLPVLSTTTAAGVANGRSSSPTSSRHAAGASTSSSSARPVPLQAPPVPSNFQPSSVTFVGTGTGWVIGQAGTPGHCATPYCTSVARTDNAGKTWAGVPAPVTGAPDGAAGVSQVRFLNLDDGWAFGPELFATHDGGHTWTVVDTHGLRVTDVQTVGDRAFGVFAACTGGGSAFATACTSFTLYSSPAGTDDWTPVGDPTTGLTGGGAAWLELTGTRGYLLAPDGMLYAGPVAGGQAWPPVARVPCAVGPAQAGGQPTGALLSAAGATNLVVACTPAPVAGGLQKKLIFTSADGGSSWRQDTVAPAAGIAASAAGSPAGTVVLGTSQGIDVLPAGSSGWLRAAVTAEPAGGFGFVGMTTDEQGVAVPADPAAGAVWFTFDGGLTWQPSRISGP